MRWNSSLIPMIGYIERKEETPMLTADAIKALIEKDSATTKKRLAKVGQRYYEGDHDIKQFRILYLNKDNKLVEDNVKSNIKICHPFFTELVDQEVQYMLSGEDGFIRSDLPELQEQLDLYFNESEDFMATLYDVITGCIVKGFEYVFAYKNKEGRTCFQCADSLGVVEVKEKETDDGCEYVIFHYVDRISKDNKKITRIQVWDSKQTWFYVQEENGRIELDKSEKYNPVPHSLYQKPGDEAIYFVDFGFIPFFRLDHSSKQTSGLAPVKGLIDDYDLMACGLSNNIQDMGEAYVAVKGFKGENLDELALNFKAKRMVGVGQNGDIEIKTVDIPYQARQTKLDLDEKNIYRFGMGFNAAQHGDGNITNVVIKSRYALLDLKCNKLEIRLKQFMRKLLKVVLDEINAEHGTDYQQKDVYFRFDRETITNEADNAQIALTEAQKRQVEINILLDLETHLGNETTMQLVCEQLDIDYEEIKDKLPKPEPDDLFDLKTIPTVPNEEGGVIE